MVEITYRLRFLSFFRNLADHTDGGVDDNRIVNKPGKFSLSMNFTCKWSKKKCSVTVHAMQLVPTADHTPVNDEKCQVIVFQCFFLFVCFYYAHIEIIVSLVGVKTLFLTPVSTNHLSVSILIACQFLYIHIVKISDLYTFHHMQSLKTVWNLSQFSFLLNSSFFLFHHYFIGVFWSHELTAACRLLNLASVALQFTTLA